MSRGYPAQDAGNSLAGHAALVKMRVSFIRIDLISLEIALSGHTYLLFIGYLLKSNACEFLSKTYA
jgi:hypothetical protein